MARRLLYCCSGVIALGILVVVGLRSEALNAEDAPAGKKSGDVISQLENRITTLERRIAALEKQRANGETKFLVQPFPKFAPRALGPQVVPPNDRDQNWCYTILIDGNAKTATAGQPKTQR